MGENGVLVVGVHAAKEQNSKEKEGHWGAIHQTARNRRRTSGDKTRWPVPRVTHDERSTTPFVPVPSLESTQNASHKTMTTTKVKAKTRMSPSRRARMPTAAHAENEKTTMDKKAATTRGEAEEEMMSFLEEGGEPHDPVTEKTNASGGGGGMAVVLEKRCVPRHKDRDPPHPTPSRSWKTKEARRSEMGIDGRAVGQRAGGRYTAHEA